VVGASRGRVQGSAAMRRWEKYGEATWGEELNANFESGSKHNNGEDGYWNPKGATTQT